MDSPRRLLVPECPTTQVRRYMRAGPCASGEFSPAVVKELDALIREAKALSKSIGHENRRAMKLILDLLRPVRAARAGAFQLP
jgi:hypothetical protein